MFLHLSSLGGMDDPCSNLVSLCHSKGLVWLVQSPLPHSQYERGSHCVFGSMMPLDFSSWQW